jgi:hypothetical protein
MGRGIRAKSQTRMQNLGTYLDKNRNQDFHNRNQYTAAFCVLSKGTKIVSRLNWMAILCTWSWYVLLGGRMCPKPQHSRQWQWGLWKRWYHLPNYTVSWHVRPQYANCLQNLKYPTINACAALWLSAVVQFLLILLPDPPSSHFPQ